MNRDIDLIGSQVELLLDTHNVSDEVANAMVEHLWDFYKIDEVNEYSQEYADLLNKIDEDIDNRSWVFSDKKGIEAYMKDFALGQLEDGTLEQAYECHRVDKIKDYWFAVER